jgi:hypothetical protein
MLSITFTFIRSTISLKLQLWLVVLYYCLRHKSNDRILTQLMVAYHEDGFHIEALEKSAVRLRAGRQAIDDDSWTSSPAGHLEK